jgi:hypothetical protein
LDLLLPLLLLLLPQVLLSVPVTSVQGFLLNAVGFVVLSMVLAAAVCLAVGLLVAPSLATDEVRQSAAQITVVRYIGGCRRYPGAIVSDSGYSSAQTPTHAPWHTRSIKGRQAMIYTAQW